MTVITSPDNVALTEIRKLSGRKWREKLGTFVAEGEDLIDAAAAAGWPALGRYVAQGTGLEGTEVAPHLLAKVSALGSGTRALGIYAQRWAPKPVGPTCIALWGVNDPGNVGTVLRSALAFGADSVALGPGTADPYSPKAVRASMGALFSVPVARVKRVDELPGTTVALVARAGHSLAELTTLLAGRPDPEGDAAELPPMTLLVGAEREGLPDAVVGACATTAHIPIARAESLNAAMAATVALYELARGASRIGRA